MTVDPAFIWNQKSAPPRRPERPDSTAPPIDDRTRISLREAEHRFGVAIATLRTWARKGAIDAVMADGPGGRQWAVTPESVAHHLSRSPRPAPRSNTPPPRAVPGRSTGPTGDGTAMLVPRDAWDKLMDQLGNLHESGLLLAEARERAAKAETEATFLRERLAEMRAERSGDTATTPHDAPRRRWWFGRR